MSKSPQPDRSMLAPCSMELLNQRRMKAGCAKCIWGRVKPCACCNSTGVHTLPGYQEPTDNGKTGLRRLIREDMARRVA